MRTCQGTEDVRNGYIEHAELSMTEGTEALRAGGRSDHAEVTTITCELLDALIGGADHNPVDRRCKW